MNIKSKLESLDNMVAAGDIMGAFEMFFSDDVITHSDAGDRSVGKDEKREWLKDFFSIIQRVDNVQLHRQTVDGAETKSEFSFEFTTTWGAPLYWHEIIRRVWRDGQVIDEYYYQGTLENEPNAFAPGSMSAAKAKATPRRKTLRIKDPELLKVQDHMTEEQKVENLTSVTKPTAKKSTKAKPKKAKSPKKVTAKKVVAKKPSVQKAIKPKSAKDDLRKIEGIGPKIAQLLNNDGIMTFEQLAKASQKRLKDILTKAGSRYQMHNPSTWPQQSSLAANNDWYALKKLQDKLDGGKKSKK